MGLIVGRRVGRSDVEERVMATGKKIAVVCTGAVGGYAGAHMVKAGEDVTFIDFWPEHVDHMKQHGLTITHLREVEPFTVPVRALHPRLSAPI